MPYSHTTVCTSNFRNFMLHERNSLFVKTPFLECLLLLRSSCVSCPELKVCIIMECRQDYENVCLSRYEYNE